MTLINVLISIILFDTSVQVDMKVNNRRSFMFVGERIDRS